MKLIGLTGGIGMGKSAAADWFADRGVPVVDTDVLAREVVAPGQPALAEIARRFGPEFLAPAVGLRRDALARLVFENATARKELEAILHPAIRARWLAVAAQWREEQRPAGVVAIPLLYETGAAGEFDQVICVACRAQTQLARLERRGWTDEQIAARIASQWPVEKKMALADFVIWSEGGLEAHHAQLALVWKQILAVGQGNQP
jgi:dephospho-CoA kinase